MDIQGEFDRLHDECLRSLRHSIDKLIAVADGLSHDLNNDPMSKIPENDTLSIAVAAIDIEKRLAELKVLRMWNISMCNPIQYPELPPEEPDDDIPF